MKYNFKKEYDTIKYDKRIDKLKSNKATIKMEEVKPKRSTSQNSLYWLWLTCIQNETGNDKNDLHKYFAKKYLGVDVVEIFGVKTEVIKSTPNNDTREFKEYLDEIQMFTSMELGISLPDPEDKHFTDFYNEFY